MLVLPRNPWWIVTLAAAACLTVHAQTISASTTITTSGPINPSAIATDSAGNVYVAGSTSALDYLSQLPEPALRVSPGGSAYQPVPLAVNSVVSVSASSDDSLILAAADSGAYRSTDRGATWTQSGGIAGQVVSLAVDPTNSQVAYAVGVTTVSGFNFYTGATWSIYKSVDGGASWQPLADFAPFPYTTSASRILINPRNSSIIYVRINSELLRSEDAGSTWTLLQIPSPKDPGGFTSPTGFAIAPSQPNVAYATTFLTNLMISNDGGLTWTAGAPIASAGENAIAVDPQHPGTVWLVVAAGIFRSTDDGLTFQKMASLGDGSWQSIAISPADSNRIFASDRHNVYGTFNGGATWSVVASGQINAVFTTGGQVFVAAAISPTVFVTKFDPTLKQTLSSTLIGAGTVSAMTVDANGNVVLTGTTSSHSFPTTANAPQRDFASSSAGFVVKIKAGGTLLYSTLLDVLTPYAVALAPDGNPVIAGAASGAVPVTANAYQSVVPGPCTRPQLSTTGSVPQEASHAFAAKFDVTGGGLIYATYLTGSCGDEAHAVAVDSTGAAYIGGQTYSLDFPVTANAMTSAFPTVNYAGFISEIGPAGDRLVYSSFIGTGFESTIKAVAVDNSGSLYAGGITDGAATPGAYHGPPLACPPIFNCFECTGNDNGFVMKMTASAAAPAFVSILGGACGETVTGMSLDAGGDIWVAGQTPSSDFPTVSPLGVFGVPSSIAGFLAEFNPTGTNLLYSDVSINSGFLAVSGSSVYFTESINTPIMQVFALDASKPPPIGIDSVQLYSGPAPPFAAYLPFPIAPGQVIRLEGHGIGPAVKADAKTAPGGVLPSIAGVGVTFNGVPAPLVSVQAAEIVCIAPFELDGLSSAKVQVQYAGQTSNLDQVPVAPFHVDVLGVANADGTANSKSNPAAINSVVTLYVTGLGQTSPPSVDGAINTTASVTPNHVPAIQVNGPVEAPVFLGAAMGQAAGIMQVNLWMPDPGPAIVNVVQFADQPPPPTQGVVIYVK